MTRKSKRSRRAKIRAGGFGFTDERHLANAKHAAEMALSASEDAKRHPTCSGKISWLIIAAEHLGQMHGHLSSLQDTTAARRVALLYRAERAVSESRRATKAACNLNIVD